MFTRPPDPREAIFQRCVRGPELRRAALVREGNLVRDTISGRLWERTRFWDTMTAQEGADRCFALTVDGQKGFRLPRVKELFSLLDVALPAPPFDDEVFPEPRGGQVMTATPNRVLSRNGVRPPVFVDFDTGQLDAAESAYVRCVR